MRLWSIHPKYLDTKGLVALWREGLLAQKVLAGNTKGYRNHPQLQRFKDSGAPMAYIVEYLRVVADEARARGYSFDESRLLADPSGKSEGLTAIPIMRGQLEHELKWLMEKVRVRSPKHLPDLQGIAEAEVHPLFNPVDGGLEDWEKAEK